MEVKIKIILETHLKIIKCSILGIQPRKEIINQTLTKVRKS